MAQEFVVRDGLIILSGAVVTHYEHDGNNGADARKQKNRI